MYKIKRAGSLVEMLQIDPKKHRIIAMVGGGGKTTLIFELARELRDLGKNVLITTTTHMSDEERYGFVPVGNGRSGPKICAVANTFPMEMLTQYDTVLVEADGSHQRAFKVPAGHEPVIPEGCDLVIGVAGCTALGKTLEEGCHRQELASECLGCELKDKITPEFFFKALTSSWGQKKLVACDYRFAVSQMDVLSEENRQKLYDAFENAVEKGGFYSIYEELYTTIEKNYKKMI